MNEFLNLTDVSEEVLKHVSPMRWKTAGIFSGSILEKRRQASKTLSS